jgi:hypothetical protein
MQYWTDLLLSPPIIIAALIIGTLGEVTKRFVLGSTKERQKAAAASGWRRIYYVTLPAHPVIAGALIGLIPWLPPAEGLEKEGYELAARIGTYSLAGIVCKIGYDTMVSTILRAIQSRGAPGGDAGGGSSSVPPEQPSDPGSTASGGEGG